MTAVEPARTGAGGGSLVGTDLELEVGPVAHGGICVARHEGRVVFVRHTLPGERVRAVVTEGRERDSYLRADAVEVRHASPDRVERPCPYAGPGRCGGCDWQHVDLPAQRELKAAVVAEQLRRLAGIEWDVVVEPVPGDTGGLGWRTRVQFTVGPEGRLGLHRHRSAELEPIGRCRIAHPAIDELEATAQPWRGAEAVEVAVSAVSRERLVVVRPSAPDRRVGVPLLAAPASVAIESDGELQRVRGRTWLAEEAVGRSWRVSGGGFWQVHPGALEALVGAVLDGLDPRPGESALDLYAGVGVFAGALAQRVGPDGSVVAVEGSRRAAADGRRNLHDLPHVRIVDGRVDRALADLATSADAAPVDLVVLDPPRAGAGRRVVDRIAALDPRAVAYVACDPAALARDLRTFADAGYRLESLRAFDLFPMTAHVECVAVLKGR